MKVLEGQPFDQIFTHTDASGVTRHFNCGAIIRAIAARIITPDFATVDLPPHIVENIEKNHGVEEVHLARLTDKQLESPVLIAEFNDGKNLVIDGNHRIVKRFRKGLRTADVLIVREPQWTPYLITDIDQTYTLEEAAKFIQHVVPHGRPSHG